MPSRCKMSLALVMWAGSFFWAGALGITSCILAAKIFCILLRARFMVML